MGVWWCHKSLLDSRAVTKIPSSTIFQCGNWGRISLTISVTLWNQQFNNHAHSVLRWKSKQGHKLSFFVRYTATTFSTYCVYSWVQHHECLSRNIFWKVYAVILILKWLHLTALYGGRAVRPFKRALLPTAGCSFLACHFLLGPWNYCLPTIFRTR